MSEEPQFEQVVRTTKVRKYKPFEGQIRAKMPALQKEGRILISPKKLEELRLHGQEGDKNYLRSVYANVAVAVVPNPSGDEIKFVPAHPLIYTLNENTPLEQGALPPAQEHYDGHDGFVLSGSEVTEFRNDNYALPNRRRAFWEFLAEGDTKLANDYETDVCQTLGLTFDKVMGLWLPNTKGLRLLGVGAVDYLGDRSIADGSGLGSSCGRLVGELAPEALDDARENSGVVPARSLVENKVWQYLKGTPAADLTRKGLQKVVADCYKQ